MTKVKPALSHNGKRPPANDQAGLGRPTSISSGMKRQAKGHHHHYHRQHHHASGIITLVFISSLLICCYLNVGLLSAVRLAAPASQQQATYRQQQVHDSISDSSSSQPVSNLSVRSQQHPKLEQEQEQQQQNRPRQPERAPENKNHLDRRLLVERDLAGAKAGAAERQNAPVISDLDAEPANHNNNNEPVAAPGEGPLNGADETAESGADDSTTDYESSDATSESVSPALPVDSSPAPAEAHARPSRQSVPAATVAITTTTTAAPTTTTRRAPDRTSTERSDFRSRQMQFVSNPRGGISLQQQQQQPSAPTEPTSFNVNMGSDRLVIKPYNQQQQQPVAMTTLTPRRTLSAAPAASAATTTTATLQPGRRDQEFRTSESVNHEFISTTQNPHRGREFAPSGGANTNDRRQDLLLYPASYNNYNNADEPLNRLPTTFTPRMGAGYSSEQQEHLHQQSICYTPVALLLVVAMTMMTTLAVCVCTHFLFKHYARRNQFDLVASSRQFDNKHAGLGSPTDHWPSLAAIGGGQQQQQQQVQPGAKPMGVNGTGSNLLSGLFMDHHRTGRSGGRNDDEFAFDNPYFGDEQPRQRPQVAESVAAAAAAAALPGGSEHMHFIQHHISDLHTRQVTSSVKELSVLSGANSSNQTAQRDLNGAGIVDLTSQEQRNKILADPKEGDLIAVDITGSDFIGLGFDVCGSQHEGIFVRSLLARGPARESGCIEVGDRIKCLNVSFDNIALQDARDILNCGAPYKMRLLLEKRAATLVGPASLTMKRRSKDTAQTLLDNYRHETSSAYKQQPIRACLRKLGNFVSRAPHDYDGQHQHQQLTRANLSEQQLAYGSAQQVLGADWLGSAAARQQRALASPFAHAHLNLAFGGSESELAQQHHKRADTIDSACSVNLRSGRLSSVDSGGQEIQFDGRPEFSPRKPQSERTDDSSLDQFHTQNAHHRLHGPARSNRNNLHLATETDTTDDDDETVGGPNDNNDRRRRRRDLGAHLEQTQSQPEIAPRAASNLNHQQQRQQQQFVGDNGPATGRFDIDFDEADNDSDDAGKHLNQRHQQQQHHKTTMLSSISTPTMNLLPLNSNIERRMSSRRRRKQEEGRTTIDEEPAAQQQQVNSSFSGDDLRQPGREAPADSQDREQT